MNFGRPARIQKVCGRPVVLYIVLAQVSCDLTLRVINDTSYCVHTNPPVWGAKHMYGGVLVVRQRVDVEFELDYDTRPQKKSTDAFA